MKYLKRLWFSLISIPAIIFYYFVYILPAIWKNGEVDDESWNPFNE